MRCMTPSCSSCIREWSGVIVDNPVRRIGPALSSWICGLCAGVLFCAPTRAAQADDWLAVLPGCAQPMAAKPELALLYPRPLLPAVVDAGAILLARVRLPAALTPPPGIQQERALHGFSAALEGDGIPLGKSAGLSHRYALPIINLRSDAASSLVYRASLVVPAFTAPGTYALVLRTPFGERRADAAVRVLAHAETVRLASLSNGGAQPSAALLRTLPVDVWMVSTKLPLPASDASEDSLGSDASAAAKAAAPLPSAITAHRIPTSMLHTQPLLGLGSPAGFALRVGSSLLVAAGPACARDPAFMAEVDAVLALERRTLAALDSIDVPAGHYLLFDGQPRQPRQPREPPRPLPQHESLLIEADANDSVFRVSNRNPESPAEVPLLLAVGQSIAVSAGELAFFPSSDVSGRSPQAITARLRIPAAGSLSLRLYEPATTPRYLLPERSACTGCPVTLEVRGVPDGARVAFDLGFARTAFGGPRIQTAFAVPGATPITALVLGPDGQASMVRTELWVAPRRPPSCTASAPGKPVQLGAWPLCLLSAAGLLLKRRRGLRFGNRLRVPPRCQPRGQHRESAVYVVHAPCAKSFSRRQPALRARSARALPGDLVRVPGCMRDHDDSEHPRRGHPREPRSGRIC